MLRHCTHNKFQKLKWNCSIKDTNYDPKDVQLQLNAICTERASEVFSSMLFNLVHIDI